MKRLISLTALAVAFGCGAAQAQYTDGTIKIGVMNDMSGTYSDLSGQGSVVAARMAVEDFGAAAKGMKVEIVGADHQNKPDVGSNVVRTWIDTDKVDVIVDVPTSSVALAVNEIVRDKNKVFLVSGAAASDLTGAEMHAQHHPLDLRHLGARQRHRPGDRQDRRRHLVLPHRQLRLRPRARARHRGGRREERRQGAGPGPPSVPGHGLLVVPAAGAGLEGQDHRARQCRRRHHQLDQAGGGVRHRQRRAEPRRAAGLPHRRQALGLQIAQGLIFTEAWYWDLNDTNREFAKKFAPQNSGVYPTMVHAGVYSAVTHYLKAVEALKSDADGKAVVAKMKEMPTDDPLFGKGTVRADGRKIHPMYLFEVKKPAESKGPWDLYKLRATIPANEAFRPLAEGGCPLVKS